MYNITPIVEAVFALIAAIITALVIPYIRSKTTMQQQAEINAWVKIAVNAAEQIYNGSGRGAEKKAYVLAFLMEHGMTLDEDKLDAMIEAAVYDLKNGLLVIESGGAPALPAEDMPKETPVLNMRYYDGDVDDDLPYVGELKTDEETGFIYDEEGDVVDEATLAEMCDGGKGDE